MRVLDIGWSALPHPVVLASEKVLEVHLELLSLCLHLKQGISQLLRGKLNFTLGLKFSHLVLEHECKLNEVPILYPVLSYE
jgi:hypothetical protein